MLGFMLFFVIVISPTAFKALDMKMASRFLRHVFPRLFAFGFVVATAATVTAFLAPDNQARLISLISAVFFLVNWLVLTPRINAMRDRVPGRRYSGQTPIWHAAWRLGRIVSCANVRFDRSDLDADRFDENHPLGVESGVISLVCSMRSVASRQWRPIKAGHMFPLYEYRQLYQIWSGPAQRIAASMRREMEDAEKDQEATQDAPPPISSVVTAAIDAPDCTTEDWLQQRACRVK